MPLETAHLRSDSQAGRECSGGVAGVSLELCRKASPQGPGVQLRTRATVSISRGSACGVRAAGASGSGEAQAHPRAGSGGASQTEALSSRTRQAGDGEACHLRPGCLLFMWKCVLIHVYTCMYVCTYVCRCIHMCLICACVRAFI